MWEVLRAPGGAVPHHHGALLVGEELQQLPGLIRHLGDAGDPRRRVEEGATASAARPLGLEHQPPARTSRVHSARHGETVAGVVTHGEGRLALLHHGPRVQRLIVNQVYRQDLVLQAAVEPPGNGLLGIPSCRWSVFVPSSL